MQEGKTLIEWKPYLEQWMKQRLPIIDGHKSKSTQTKTSTWIKNSSTTDQMSKIKYEISNRDSGQSLIQSAAWPFLFHLKT